MPAKPGQEIIQMMQHIAETEWEMFQNVNSLGGRASCQDDSETFEIMRLSQFVSWTPELMESYALDLELAQQAGRNLVTEKYGYMMEFTDPQYFEQNLRNALPPVDAGTMKVIDEITEYLVRCEEDFAKAFPKLSRSGRPISGKHEAFDFTSVEIYAVGELKTYSRKTLDLYRDHVRNCRVSGKNLVFTVKDMMVKLYGYASLEDAEQKMQ